MKKYTVRTDKKLSSWIETLYEQNRKKLIEEGKRPVSMNKFLEFTLMLGLDQQTCLEAE